MSLTRRSRGYEMSVVERELVFNDKYSNVGFVKYDTKEGDYFYLHPSPFLRTFRNEIYHISDSPPPECQFIEAKVVDDNIIPLSNSGETITVKEVSSWKFFDPTPLAQRRKLLDFEEVIEYFTHPLKGEETVVEEIAWCASLFAFSSPPITDEVGGIKTAVYGKNYQWELFRRPLKCIPFEFLKPSSDYYYYISKTERNPGKTSGEINLAIFQPERLLSDIPIIFENISERKFSRDGSQPLKEEAGIITAYLLDALLLKPTFSDKIEDMMHDAVYRLRDEYYSSGQRAYHQNIGDALPKLASAYARLRASPDITQEDVNHVMDLWFTMYRKAKNLPFYPATVSDLYLFSGDSRKVYVILQDVYGSDCWIPLDEAIEATGMDEIEVNIAIDTLVEKGYCRRKAGHIMLLDKYRRKM